MIAELDDREVHERETVEHIHLVRDRMMAAIGNLLSRAMVHDRSKLSQEEAPGFIAMKRELELAGVNYTDASYRDILKKYGPATIHKHYAANDHHPEHWPNGIRDMSLLSVLEMLCDWDAASKRMKGGGDLRVSIEHNQGRFGYSDDVKSLLLNTARELGLL